MIGSANAVRVWINTAGFCQSGDRLGYLLYWWRICFLSCTNNTASCSSKIWIFDIGNNFRNSAIRVAPIMHSARHKSLFLITMFKVDQKGKVSTGANYAFRSSNRHNPLPRPHFVFRIPHFAFCISHASLLLIHLLVAALFAAASIMSLQRAAWHQARLIFTWKTWVLEEKKCWTSFDKTLIQNIATLFIGSALRLRVWAKIIMLPNWEKMLIRTPPAVFCICL